MPLHNTLATSRSEPHQVGAPGTTANSCTGMDLGSFPGQVWALRHGEAAHNVLKAAGEPETMWYNLLDPELTHNGHQDAATCVIPELNNPLFVCSPLKRTLATAVGIVANHGGCIVAHPALQEAHNADRPGDPRRLCDTGVPLSELSELPWVNEVDFSLCGENWMDDARTVEQRVPDLLQWLQQNSHPNQDIVIVTHNGVLRRMLGWVDAPHCTPMRLSGSQAAEPAEKEEDSDYSTEDWTWDIGPSCTTRHGSWDHVYYM